METKLRYSDRIQKVVTSMGGENERKLAINEREGICCSCVNESIEEKHSACYRQGTFFVKHISDKGHI